MLQWTRIGTDVMALYPSIKFEFVRIALLQCFRTCTNWSIEIINTLIEIIIYTLSNQQIMWNDQYYLLNQGLPTGAKHSVPIANILLSFILLQLLRSGNEFKNIFDDRITLWKRFIDDGGGILSGNIYVFMKFFKLLRSHFNTFALDLTCAGIS